MNRQADHYDRLPPVSVFLHAHRDGYPAAWHTDARGYSNVESVRHLRLAAVRARGFVNLRCIWDPGCPAEIQPFRAHAKPGPKNAELAFRNAWPALFGVDVPVPLRVATPCCAQFAVSDTAVRRNPRAAYVRYRQWLLDTELDDDTSGRIFEYLWHIIFGRGAVM